MHQLTIFHAIDAREPCAECGETFDADELNHYGYCPDCLDTLEALADIQSEMVQVRNRRFGYEAEPENYEAELMGLPGTRRWAAKQQERR